jgi:hypothetical protein
LEIHKPKPVQGWREFLTEIGIIVIGVLVALSAEQVVENIRMGQEVRSFRETINHEIGLNLFVYDVRARQFPCEGRRIAALQTWLGEARSGARVPALIPAPLKALAPYRSAWDNRNAVVFNHLEPEVRQKYAEFYDELANNSAIISSEQENWVRLLPYQESGPIGLSDRRTIREVIGRLAIGNQAFAADIPFSRKIADVLKAKEIQPDNIPADWLRSVADCPSVIASASN